ncbi:MAG: hypothetical protein LBM69_10940 [Lachnospiraceae bacterium]|jgi:hypothetical protein|nr:hypothetical protein [Lachnospiraceae bacterium]
MDCCFGGAVTRALNYMGEAYTYEQIMGMSGACYRIHFTDVWDWSATDALVAYGYDAPLCRAIGYEAVWAGRIEAKDRVAERRNIVSDIQLGRPIVAINLRVAPEWGVITGYGDNGKTLYCRTYFDKVLLNEDGMAAENANLAHFDSKGEYLLADNWPWGIMHLRKKSPCDHEQSMTAEEILRQSLQTAVSSFEQPQERGYWQGEQAYEHWIAGLKDDSLWNRDNMRDDFSRRASVNECTLRSLIDERRCAAVPLCIYVKTA